MNQHPNWYYLDTRLVPVVVMIVFLLKISTIHIMSLRLIFWTFLIAITFAWLSVITALFFVRVAEFQDPLRRIRPLGISSQTSWNKELHESHQIDRSGFENLLSCSPEISKALQRLLDTFQQELIKSWYASVSPDQSFPVQVEDIMRCILIQVSKYTQKVQISKLVLGKALPLLTSHLHEFSAADRAVRGHDLNITLTESEELDMAIASRYREGELHPAVGKSYSDMEHAQQDHLRRLTGKVLPLIIPPSEADSRVVRYILQELVSCGILYPIMCFLSNPDIWNRLIGDMGKSTLQERKTVRRLRDELDKHAKSQESEKLNASIDNLQPPILFTRLTPQDDERTFERFIRSMRMCNNISDARRLRTEITAQLKRDVTITDSTEGWMIYLRRLETVKRLIEQRVFEISNSHEYSGTVRQSVSEIAEIRQSGLESAGLEEVLQESAGLSYFMEFMDRQCRLALVQFWLVVSGLRNPLEDDASSSDEQDNVTGVFAPWSVSNRNDIAQIYDAYLSNMQLHISENCKRSVKEFLKFGNRASQMHYVKARSAILRAQTAVFDEMKRHDFPAFRSSDLFYKYMASDETGKRSKSFPAKTNGKSDHIRVASSEKILTPTGARFHWMDKKDLLETDEIVTATNNRNPPLFLTRTDTDSTAKNMAEDNLVQALEAALSGIIDNPLNEIDEKNTASNVQDCLQSCDNSDTRAEPSGLQQRLFPSPLNKQAKEESHTKDDSGTKLNVLTAPNLTSLGLVAKEIGNGVFDTELFPEEKSMLQECEALDECSENDYDGFGQVNSHIQLAAACDLDLTETMFALNLDIQSMMTQEGVLDSLLRKAELTNNTLELRILRKSKASLSRDIRQKELQRQYYVVQESDNSLFGRSTVEINSTIVENDGGQDYALYVIDVGRKAEHFPAVKWSVSRRYSEFFQLHQTLKRIDSVGDLDFPRRRVVMKLQKDFLEKRRIGLEKYLKSLLLIPDVCQCQEFRAFLSQQKVLRDGDFSPPELTAGRKDIVARLYASIADGMEDVFGCFPALDEISPPSISIPSTTNLSSDTISERTSFLDTGPSFRDTSGHKSESGQCAFEDREVETIVKPISDFFMEIFDLRQKSNWLRGRAVVVVLHRLLGGTIERKFNEIATVLFNRNSMLGYIEMINSTLKAHNKKQGFTPRSTKEKAQSKMEASIILSTLIPDLSTSVVGKTNAESAGRRIFAMCNNLRLNISFLYTVLDELVLDVFGVTVDE